MLMRFDPFRQIDRLTQELFDHGARATAMPMDAYRRGDEFVVRFDVPGVDPASIELTVEKSVLTVTAERRWEPGADDQVLASERPQGRYTRQLFLGENLDTDRVEAGYDAGVLTVTIPVAEQAKPRKVQINSSGTSGAIEAESSAA